MYIFCYYFITGNEQCHCELKKKKNSMNKILTFISIQYG